MHITLRLSTIVLCIAGLTTGCDGDDPKEEGGAEAGQAGAMSAGIEGGGASGGAEPGGVDVNAGGVSAGVMGGTAGGEAGMDYGRVNPNDPLPTPAQTTLPTPESITTPSDGGANTGCTGSWVEEARGWVVDEVGQPLEGAKVQLCVRIAESGALVCLMPADSASDGSFGVTVPTDARCMSGATFRSLIPREKFAPIYCHAGVSEVSADGVLRVTEPLVLYETRPATSLEESGDLTTAHYAGDVSLTLNPEAIYGPSDLNALWGRALSTDAPGLCFLEEGGPQLDFIFTFSPEGDVTGETATVKLANSAGYEPGAELALYALGNLDCSVVGQDEGVEEGEWTQVGTATVDATGMWVEASGANGLPCLSWFGYGPLP